jgi:hypothetical protein
VAERLLDHHPRVPREAGVGEALHDAAEEERRDLEVEDRCARPAERRGDALIRRRIGEVARHVRQPGGEALEDPLVQRLAAGRDRDPRVVAQIVGAPVVDGDADDRAVEQAAPFEPVQRSECHHLREIARDPEGDERVGGPSRRLFSGAPRLRSECGGHALAF